VIHVRSWGIGGRVVGPGAADRAWLGASRGGAVDLDSFALANRLVGNARTSLAFETSGGLAFSVSAPTMVVVTGAVAEVSVTGGSPIGWGSPVVLPAGAVVRLTRLLDGARAYVAVRGGLVEAGDSFATGPDPQNPAAEHIAARRTPSTTIRVWPGPRVDWFTDGARRALTSEEFVVTTTSAVGTRLDGPPLERARHGELPSEGLVEGAVQVPPDGRPIIMLSGHPTTGGYPVIAVVDPTDIGAVAQAAPGTALRFTLRSDTAWFGHL
jgi:allophanate hydrolase subunit 2